MKRNLLLASFAGLALMMSANDKSIRPRTATIDEYLPVIKAATGCEVYSFDITDLLDSCYNIIPTVKEYVNGKLVENNNQYRFAISNKMLVTDFPEEQHAKIRAKGLADPATDTYTQATELNIGFYNLNDSTKAMNFELPTQGTQGKNFKLLTASNPEGTQTCRVYQTRPFKSQEFKCGTMIPLVLLGSAWWDTRFKVFRFCGENEINPDMSEKFISEIPHFYVIGVEVQKKNK
jgi:hypothetical protein